MRHKKEAVRTFPHRRRPGYGRLEDDLCAYFDPSAIDSRKNGIALKVSGGIEERIRETTLGISEVACIDEWSRSHSTIIAVDEVISDSAKLHAEPLRELHILQKCKI